MSKMFSKVKIGNINNKVKLLETVLQREVVDTELAILLKNDLSRDFTWIKNKAELFDRFLINMDKVICNQIKKQDEQERQEPQEPPKPHW